MEVVERGLPCARREGLVIQELPDELLVYDLERHRAHCLNPAAVLVWNHCDGRTTVEGIAKLLGRELNVPVDEGIVRLALDQLGNARLLREQVTRQPSVSRASRRELLRRAGLIAASLPLVISIIAPTVVQAASICSIANPDCNTATIGCCCVGNHKKCVADVGQPDGASCKGSVC